MVYEQRRTNAILIAGFSSLGQAIEHLGDRIVTAISGLAVSLDCRLASLESSLESTANAAAEQSAALRAELQRSTGVNEAVLGQLRQDAEARTESERLALRMLDNIQRRRKPTMWERP
jgi:DNA anti-recombination protein RmuC